MKALLALAGITITLTACGGSEPEAAQTQLSTVQPVATTAPTTEPPDTPMQAIHDECVEYAMSTLNSSQQKGYTEKLDIAFVTDSESVSVDGAWAEDLSPTLSGLLGDVLSCVLVQTEAPQRVTEHIDSTRAMDGMQTDSWDDYEARWNFHPDSGMSLTVWMP